NTVYRLNNVRAMQPMAALNHTRKSLLKFQEKLGIEPVNLEETRWNFWGAVFYCMTVYTTIGKDEIKKSVVPHLWGFECSYSSQVDTAHKKW
ncbi:hypothetical protein COOONC_26511, partial [Cooperia oncophora]